LITIAIFLAVALGIFALISSFDKGGSQSRVLRQRLEAVANAAERKPSEELTLLRDELLSEIPALNRLLARSSRIPKVQKLLSQAEVKVRAGKFLLGCAAAGAISGLLVLLWTRGLIFAVMATAAGATLPFWYVSYRRASRFKHFEERFPEAIDLLARAVRAGHAFTTSLEIMADELAEPVAGEFRKLFEEQKFGIPVRDALLNLADRVPLVDVKFFVTAVMLQRETGGNLAEILDKLSYVIRERFKILRQVKVYTAQGRLTMMILMALPPGLVLLMFLVNREFIQPLFADPIGHMLLAAGITLQTIGFFLIRKIIHIQV